MKPVRHPANDVSGSHLNAVVVFEKPQALVDRVERQPRVAGDVDAHQCAMQIKLFQNELADLAGCQTTLGKSPRALRRRSLHLFEPVVSRRADALRPGRGGDSEKLGVELGLTAVDTRLGTNLSRRTRFVRRGGDHLASASGPALSGFRWWVDDRRQR